MLTVKTTAKAEPHLPPTPATSEFDVMRTLLLLRAAALLMAPFWAMALLTPANAHLAVA